MLLIEQHSAVSPGIVCRRSDGQPLTSSCTYRGNIRYTSSGADCPAPDTSKLSSVGFVCSLPQYLKQELFFRQLTDFYFFISQNKRDPSWQ